MKRVIYAVLLAVLVGLDVGCKDKEAQAGLEGMKAQAELEARNIELIKMMIAELDKGNAEILLKVYAPDAKYYYPSGNPKPMSREDEIAQFKRFLKAFPDLVHEIPDIFAVKDKVVARFVVRATHQAMFGGIPPTGNKIVISPICIFRIKGGLVVEEIEESDILGLFQQLGMELKPKKPAK